MEKIMNMSLTEIIREALRVATNNKKDLSEWF